VQRQGEPHGNPLAGGQQKPVSAKVVEPGAVATDPLEHRAEASS
jgi:hypothetical protein